jgi:hypothetical protein
MEQNTLQEIFDYLEFVGFKRSDNSFSVKKYKTNNFNVNGREMQHQIEYNLKIEYTNKGWEESDSVQIPIYYFDVIVNDERIITLGVRDIEDLQKWIKFD